MLILTHNITPRLQYVANFFAKELCNEEAILTTNQQEYLRYAGIKINYTNQQQENDRCQIKPHTLLFEEGLRPQVTEVFQINSYPAFFKTEGSFGFDVLAASFYLLSRYEEYLPHTKDEYGRFAHTDSLAYKNDFLSIPLVNIWLGEVKRFLQIAFPDSPFASSAFQFIPTYDIDHAYAFKYRSSGMHWGGILKDIITGNFKRAAQRKRVAAGKEKDPFDAYDWMDELHSSYELKPIYFFLLAQKNKGYDKNILPATTGLQALIKQLAVKYDLGIHPSWQSGDDETLLKQEKDLLEQMINKPVVQNRQHYIRMTLPHTYRQLLAEGITEDYSMGYGSINGFRASLASPYCWYDVEKEEQTNLLLYPFCFMDANSFYEQKQTAEETGKELQHYYEQIKKVNGTFITLWHNNFLGSDTMFKGWKEVYEAMVKKIAEQRTES